MQIRLATVCVATGIFLISLPLRAHHAFAAEFDGDKRVKLQGIITKMEWINPHAWIHIDVKDADGKVVNWMIECGSPNTLLRQGMTRNSVTPGMAIVIDGYQAKDGSNRANGRDVTFPDGRQLFLGSRGSGAPDEQPQK
jgi:Family of unknown function (DUF6152)